MEEVTIAADLLPKLEDCPWPPKMEGDMSEWISVKDRLPENDSLVFVLCNGREPDTDHYGLEVDGEWYFNCSTEVTHWMPIPEPPK